jgi:hypothetical protein
MPARPAPRIARAALVALALAGGPTLGQQPIDAPLLKPFADNRQWVVFEDVRYRLGQSAYVIVVPRGFVTDFASIPQPFWGLGLSPNGRYSKAAIIHDYLYWSQGCTRQQADNILVIAMKESEVDAGLRNAIYNGVRLGGDAAWKSNAGERAARMPRVIPDAALAFGPNVLWPEYRQTLQQSGVADPDFPSAPDYCAAGDSTDVP